MSLIIPFPSPKPPLINVRRGTTMQDVELAMITVETFSALHASGVANVLRKINENLSCCTGADIPWFVDSARLVRDNVTDDLRRILNNLERE